MIKSMTGYGAKQRTFRKLVEIRSLNSKRRHHRQLLPKKRT